MFLSFSFALAHTLKTVEVVRRPLRGILVTRCGLLVPLCGSRSRTDLLRVLVDPVPRILIIICSLISSMIDIEEEGVVSFNFECSFFPCWDSKTHEPTCHTTFQ